MSFRFGLASGCCACPYVQPDGSDLNEDFASGFSSPWSSNAGGTWFADGVAHVIMFGGSASAWKPAVWESQSNTDIYAISEATISERNTDTTRTGIYFRSILVAEISARWQQAEYELVVDDINYVVDQEPQDGDVITLHHFDISGDGSNFQVCGFVNGVPLWEPKTLSTGPVNAGGFLAAGIYATSAGQNDHVGDIDDFLVEFDNSGPR